MQLDRVRRDARLTVEEVEENDTSDGDHPHPLGVSHGMSALSETPSRPGGSAVGVVIEPSADDDRPELRLGLKTERLVERLGMVGL